MTNIGPRLLTTAAMATLAVAGLFTTAACSTDTTSSGERTAVSITDPPVESSSGTGQTTSAQTTSSTPAPSSPSASRSDDGHTTYTDRSLAALLGRVRVDGKPLSPMPVATVRSGGAEHPEITPKACEFAGTGFLPVIRQGAPAAIALNSTGLGATLIDAGSDDKARAELAKRNTMLQTPACATLKASHPAGGTTTLTISSSRASIDGLEDARYMVSTTASGTKKVQQVTLSGHHDGVLVNVAVPSDNKAKVDQIMKLILNELD